MIRIVTIEREYGSGGGDIARRLAEHLGWELWDQQLTEEIARLANCPRAVVEGREERNDPLYYRLFKSFVRGSYEGSLNAHKMKMVDSESILRITERVVRHAASKGDCVIVGRGGQHFLKNNPDTLRVFLYACRDDKVRRLVHAGKSEREAHELIDTVDRDRSEFVDKYFHVEWPGRAVYHAMINTSIGDEAVVQTVVYVMKSFEPVNCPEPLPLGASTNSL